MSTTLARPDLNELYGPGSKEPSIIQVREIFSLALEQASSPRLW
jgi:hypothetical protein